MKCEWCGKDLLGKYQKRFCDRSCSGKHNASLKKNPPKYCHECGKEFSSDGKKFCSRECFHLDIPKRAQIKREIEVSRNTHSALAAKKFLLNTNNKCWICGLKDTWNDKSINLILDHIDGNSTNNNMSNLRLVCPNCDSQLPTFKSRNMGNGRHSRMKRYHSGESY